MNPVILMRHSLAEEEEYLAAQKYFPVHSTRASLPEDSLVIGRYSVLPYYGELCDDLACLIVYLLILFIIMFMWLI